MTVETNANYISDFNKAYPRNRDLIKEGDDHIRLVKAVLQNTFPGMDKAVNPDSDKLNKLDATFEYEGSNLGINNSFTIAKNRELDFGGNILSNIGDPKEPTDAINLQSLQGSLMWPIGSIFLTVDSRNPKEILGFGTWEKFAAGRVLIGTGTTTDINNVSKTFVNEAKGGAFQSTMTSDQLPKHTHKGAGETSEAGRHNHGFPAGGGSDGSGGRRAVAIDIGVNDAYEWIGEREGVSPAVNSSGAHKHEVAVTVEETGGGKPFDIMQPFIACNMWLRKADKEPTP